MNRKKRTVVSEVKKSASLPDLKATSNSFAPLRDESSLQQQRLLALKNKHQVPSVPFQGQKIPAVIVNVESSNVLKLIICIGASEMTVMMSLYEAHVPLSHSFDEKECKAAAAVEEYLTTTLHMFELVEVMFICCDDQGRFCGNLYFGCGESINDSLVKDGFASKVRKDWTAEDFVRMVRSRGGTM